MKNILDNINSIRSLYTRLRFQPISCCKEIIKTHVIHQGFNSFQSGHFNVHLNHLFAAAVTYQLCIVIVYIDVLVGINYVVYLNSINP